MWVLYIKLIRTELDVFHPQNQIRTQISCTEPPPAQLGNCIVPEKKKRTNLVLLKLKDDLHQPDSAEDCGSRIFQIVSAWCLFLLNVSAFLPQTIHLGFLFQQWSYAGQRATTPPSSSTTAASSHPEPLSWGKAGSAVSRLLESRKSTTSVSAENTDLHKTESHFLGLIIFWLVETSHEHKDSKTTSQQQTRAAGFGFGPFPHECFILWIWTGSVCSL